MRRGHTFSSHHHAARARAVGLLAAMVVFLFGSVASAMPAPMCNDSAQSIAAPFPTQPTKNGEVRGGTPCENRPGHELGRAPSGQHDQVPPPELPHRVPPVKPATLPRDRGRAVRPAIPSRPMERPGFAQGVFRPPRSAS